MLILLAAYLWTFIVENILEISLILLNPPGIGLAIEAKFFEFFE